MTQPGSLRKDECSACSPSLWLNFSRQYRIGENSKVGCSSYRRASKCLTISTIIRRTDLYYLWQMLAGLPFLIEDWRAYLSRAFEFTRVFIPFWSVNWRFLPDNIFLSRSFALVLLACHGGTLFIAATLWCQPLGGLKTVITRAIRYPDRPASLGKTPSPNCKARILAGMTLRANLYSYYYHYRHCDSPVHLQSHWNAVCALFTLPILRMGGASAGFLVVADTATSSCQVGVSVCSPHKISAHPVTNCRLALLIGIEVGYETYPSTALSSAALVASHAGLVLAVLGQVDWDAL